jgi:serine protease Do
MTRWSIPLACLLLGGLVGSFVAGPALLGQHPGQPATVTNVPKELTSYRGVVKTVLPAVVSIEGRLKKVKATGPSSRRQPQFDDQQVPEEFRKFFEDFGRQMPEQDDSPVLGFGSGFIVDPKGVILTNYHVVNGADQVEVTLPDGRKFLSRDIKGDRKTDLAIVRIDAKKGELPYLELGDSNAMEIGDRVLAVGAPFGLTGSVTSGIVSAKGRNGLNVNLYEDFIQTDAAINPGNSGGPLVNLEGKVIGINSAIKTRTGGFQGVGLAIASNFAKNIMKALETDGLVHRGYLGIQMADLKPEVASRLNLRDKSGVVVGKVMEGSPADKAGLQAGDIITSLAGKSVKDGKELQQTVMASPLHRPVELTVYRDGKTQNLQVTIEEQPETFGVAQAPRFRAPRERANSVNLNKLGLSLKDLTPETAEQLGFKGIATGALISRVDSDSAAAKAGLRPDMLITQVDKKPVQSAADVQKVVEKASLEKGILFKVQAAQGGVNYVVVKSESEK